MAGIANNGLVDLAKYWKNGISMNFSNDFSQAFANAIFVSDTDAYVAGGGSDGTLNSTIVTWLS